jgi:hypothetical protein
MGGTPTVMDNKTQEVSMQVWVYRVVRARVKGLAGTFEMDMGKVAQVLLDYALDEIGTPEDFEAQIKKFDDKYPPSKKK